MTTSRRRMRRYARQVRRGGMQPMMVFSSDNEFPETVPAMLLRSAWRHRSELAPLGIATAMLSGSWWLHSAHP